MQLQLYNGCPLKLPLWKQWLCECLTQESGSQLVPLYAKLVGDHPPSQATTKWASGWG
jgi:hypothetical protein